MFIFFFIFRCIQLLFDRFTDRLIGLVGRVFPNGPGDRGPVPGRVITKTLKKVLDTFLLYT